MVHIKKIFKKDIIFDLKLKVYVSWEVCTQTVIPSLWIIGSLAHFPLVFRRAGGELGAILFVYKYLHSISLYSADCKTFRPSPAIKSHSAFSQLMAGSTQGRLGLQCWAVSLQKGTAAAERVRAAMPSSWWERASLPAYRVPSTTRGPCIRRLCPDSSPENPNKK